MQTHTDAVYDGEALRPSRPLDLRTNQHYSITITDETSQTVDTFSTGSPLVSVGDSESISDDLAWSIYDNRLKPLLEPEHNGKVVAVDIDTGDYEVATRSLAAWKALRARRPNGRIVFIVIGPVSQHSSLARRLSRTIPRKEANS